VRRAGSLRALARVGCGESASSAVPARISSTARPRQRQISCFCCAAEPAT
jgi:hypothetical protein